MGLFKDRRHRRTGGLSGTHASHEAQAAVGGADRDDEQLRLDVEEVIARELGAATALDQVHGVRPVTRARVIEWISDYGYSYFIDSDGDVGGLWHSRLFYFLIFGSRSEILQVRGQWNREISIERIEEVLDLCNEWNTDRIWPKAYFRVRDNGMIQVYAEMSVDLEHGATDEQLDRLLSCGLSTAAMLFDSLDAHYPDPAKAAP
ncbi:YbjN domain-containing protein [Sanguibacter inulinus]|jgi:hypothetical protein|uniref:YbjN domain-containing protein n=1 Tax=Sanguibacter inulinus TaxID=60922 RepID=A0A853EV30_9MICO|nr:YbjN domain-containing protein [Sanguibacter inulinus]MBF0723264.1 YbjN domain-containing protein [Sanguibacter inulinus]NYS94409.1 YbjN domain-containing protein [Sanguibacter inulinus]